MPYRLLEACRQGLYVKPRLGYNQSFSPDFSMKYHRHDTIEFMYAVEDTFSCNIVSEDNVLHRVVTRPRSCLVINNAVRHCLVIDRKTQILNVEFEFQEEPEGAYPLTELYEKLSGFRQLAESDQDFVVFPNCSEILSSMRSLLDSIVKHPQNPDPALAFQQTLYVATFFTELTLNYRHSELTQQQGQYIETVKAFIDENFSENLTIAQIAQTVNLHPNYLERLFKKAENSTIMDYLNHQRILKAAYLLRSTNRPVESIAYEVGFNNRQHFSKMFNRFLKMSPREYRTLLNVKNYSDDEIDARMIIDDF